MEQKKKKRGSIKIRIMLPVLVLGIVAVISNITAMTNIRKVNENAADRKSTRLNSSHA